MVRRYTIAAALSLAGACRATPADKADTGETVATECVPDSAPTIDGISIGQNESEQGEPSLLVQIQASDADGDLNRYEVGLWFDDEVDGAVDRTSYNHIGPGPVDLGVPDCSAPAISSEVEIVLLGDGVLAFDTVYEFVAVITDAQGLDSAPALTSGKTPRER